MKEYKERFIKFLIDQRALMLGRFTLKSGRTAPYFVDMGKIGTGRSLRMLGSFYMEAIEDNFNTDDFDVLFGPAYKGICIATSTAMAFSEAYNLDVPCCYDRKEVKDHGEGGGIIGHQLQNGQRVLIVEDVMTSGKSIEETIPKLTAAANIRLAGEMIAVDRMEVANEDDTERATITKSREFGMPIFSIVTLDDILEYLGENSRLERIMLDQIREYRQEFARPR